MTSEHREARRAIDRHFAGRLRPEAERTMRAHVLECAECRAHYEKHLVLSRLDPAAMPASDRLARGLGLGRSRASRARLWLVPALALTGAAALLLAPRSQDDGFRARGGDGTASGGGQVVVFRVVDHDRRELVGDRLQVADELAFAYRNPTGKKYLAVFGRDDTGRVYWYVPQWLDATARPRAVPAEPGPELHDIPIGVRHDISGRVLSLHAVLIDEPLDVVALERLAGGLSSPSSPLALGGAVQEVIVLRVER